jgi:hypothetical protein
VGGVRAGRRPDPGKLLRGRDLDAGRRLDPLNRERLTDAQREFIDVSDAAWEAEQRRLREALAEAREQRSVAEREMVAANLRERALRVRLLLSVEPVAGLALAADTVITNLDELPDELVDVAQVSLHAALLQARELAVVSGHAAPV